MNTPRSKDYRTDPFKGDRQKVGLARRLRGETTMTLDWIAERLNMGTASHLANCLRLAKPE